MDQIKIGKFLSELRKEKSLTQEALGEKIGVTNKTVSRWENGHYLPDIEMLMILSREFDVTINELISGERLDETQYKEKAEANLKNFVAESTFTKAEMVKYYKWKWYKERISLYVVWLLFYAVGFIILVNKEMYDWMAFSIILNFVGIVVHNNQMMKYIEDRVYKKH